MMVINDAIEINIGIETSFCSVLVKKRHLFFSLAKNNPFKKRKIFKIN